MDGHATLLREVAGELRTVARLVADRHGALPLAIQLADDPTTWQGRWAEGFANELRLQQGSLHNAEEGLVRLASWLEQVAADREMGLRAAPPPSLPATD